MNKPTITDQQVARRFKTSLKLLRENPQLLEACRSVIACGHAVKNLKSTIKEKKEAGE